MKTLGSMEVERLMDEEHVMIKTELNFFDLYYLSLSEEAREVMEKFKDAGKIKQFMNHIVGWYMGTGNTLFYDLPDVEELDYYIANELEEDMRREGK